MQTLGRIQSSISNLHRTRQLRPTALQTLTWPILLCSLPMFILAFLLPIYAQELGATATDIGGLFAVFSIAMIVVRPLVGMAMDRYGRRYFLLSGLGAYLLAMGVFSIADTLTLLYVARLIQGIGAALTWIATYTIAAELALSERRGEAIGRADGAGERGGVYGALLAFTLLAWIPLRSGWSFVFIGYTGCAIVGIWLAWRFVPETKMTLSEPVGDDERGATKTKERAAGQSHAGVLKMLGSGLGKLFFVVFLTKASQALINPLLLIFLRDRFALEIWQLALAYLPATLILGFLPAYMGRLSDRIGRAPLIAIGLTISSLTAFVMPDLTHLGWFVAIFAVYALGTVAATPAQKAMVGDLTRREHWGRAFGLYTFTASLGTAVGPLLGGWLYDQTGPAAPFYANTILLLVSAVWTIFLLSPRDLRPWFAHPLPRDAARPKRRETSEPATTP